MFSIELELRNAVLIPINQHVLICGNLQGYRVSTEQQMSVALLAEDGSTSHAEMPDLEMVRDAAISIYNQYLSEKVSLSVVMLCLIV